MQKVIRSAVCLHENSTGGLYNVDNVQPLNVVLHRPPSIAFTLQHQCCLNLP